MAETIKNSTSMGVVADLVNCIRSHVDYLSEVDGKIGDGDHGINMNKGFSLAGKKLEGRSVSMSDALTILGDVLVSDIGGSMGPIYGSYFTELGDTSREDEEIGKETYLRMYQTALEAVESLGGAKQGDKTMLDTMIPAVKALRQAVEQGKPFSLCLEKMTAAARTGMESTKDLVAKVGRSARLGERSRGVLDAGAVSCFLIIESMGTSVCKMLD